MEANPVSTIAVITAVLGILLAISEALSLNPKVKSNGVFQMIWNILKGAVKLLGGKKK